MNRKVGKTDIIFYEILFTGLMFLAITGILMHWAPYRLEFKEQISIFLLGADRISWYLSNPAVVASVLGDWLTQFYINGRLGAVLSALLLLAVWLGLVRFFRLSQPGHRPSLMVLMIPILIETGFITSINYPVSDTIGLAISVWAACAFAHSGKSGFSPFLYALSVPVMYVITGCHAFTFALLLGFGKRRDGIMQLAGILAGIVLMMICGRLYNLTPIQTLLWPVSKGYVNPSRFWMLAQPWIIFGVMFLSLLISGVKSIGLQIGIASFIFITGCSVLRSSVKSELEDIVKIGTLAYHNQWDEVRKMALANSSGQYSAFYWNLCNAREGTMADGLLKGPWGLSQDVLFLSTTRGDSYFNMIYFTDALLEIGDVSQATDCALLAQTVMPGHYSTRLLRRLAEIAVVTQDYAVARKYLNILMRTRNHKEWAAEMLDCIENDRIPEQYLVWRSRTIPTDHFFRQGDIQSSLSIIASQSPYNRVAIDYMLCSALLDKRLNSFISLYDEYYLDGLDRIVKVPDLYQEALLVNVNSNESMTETVNKYRISPSVVQKYMNQLHARSNSDDPHVLTEDARGTYWHYIMAVKLNANQE